MAILILSGKGAYSVSSQGKYTKISQKVTVDEKRAIALEVGSLVHIFSGWFWSELH